MSENMLVFGLEPRYEATRDFAAAVAKKAAATEVPVETLKENLQAFLNSLGEIIPQEKENLGFELSEFAVAVGIDASGTVGFLGTGAEVGANASLTLTFKKRKQQ